MVTQSSVELNTIGEDVTASMSMANNSVADLSAMTEELAATMEGIGQNAVLINENAISVKEHIFCKSGMTDLYILFYEIGIKMLIKPAPWHTLRHRLSLLV